MKLKLYAISGMYNREIRYYAFWPSGSMWVSKENLKDVHFFTKLLSAYQASMLIDPRDYKIYENIKIEEFNLEVN